MISHGICLSLYDLLYLVWYFLGSSMSLQWHSFILFYSWVVFHLEKEMATHSSVLAWRIPWMEKPGRLQSMGLHIIGHDWSDLAAAVFHYIYKPTPHLFLSPSSVDRYWGCFLVSSIVNSAAKNTEVHVSLQIMVSSGYMPRNGVAGSYSSSIFSFFFMESPHCFL